MALGLRMVGGHATSCVHHAVANLIHRWEEVRVSVCKSITQPGWQVSATAASSFGLITRVQSHLRVLQGLVFRLQDLRVLLSRMHSLLLLT